MIHVMKRCILLLVLLVFAPRLARAQTPEWSAPEKGDNRYIKIIGQDDEGFFVLKSNMPLSDYRLSSGLKRRDYSLSYYSDDMKLRWEKPVTPFAKDDKALAVVFLDGKPVVVNVHILADEKKFILSAQKINNTGAAEGAVMPVNEMFFERKNELEDFDFIVSQNQKRLLCFQNGTTSDGNQAFSTILMNASLETEYKKIVQLPVLSKEMSVASLVLSNDARLYVLDKNRREGKAEGAGYSLFSYNYGKDSLASAELNLEGKFISAAMPAIDNANKRLVVAGFYSEKNSYSIAGTCYISLNYSTLAVNVSRTEPFEPTFLTRVIGESQANKGKELTNYYIDRVILRNDGGAVVVAESFYTSTSSYYDVFLQSYMTRTNYHYNSIITVSMNPDGSMHWPQVINKSQTSQEDGGLYSSYCLLPYQNKIYFIYNEFSGRTNRVMISSISNTSQQTNSILFKGNEQVVLISRAAKQTDQDVLIIPGERNEKFCYLKLSF